MLPDAERQGVFGDGRECGKGLGKGGRGKRAPSVGASRIHRRRPPLLLASLSPALASSPSHPPQHTPQDDLNTTLEAFRERHGDVPKKDDLTILVPRADDPSAQIFVFYPEEPKVGVKVIKTFAERMRGEGVARAIVVAAAPLTPFARQCLAEMAPKYTVEVVSLAVCWECVYLREREGGGRIDLVLKTHVFSHLPTPPPHTTVPRTGAPRQHHAPRPRPPPHRAG